MTNLQFKMIFFILFFLLLLHIGLIIALCLCQFINAYCQQDWWMLQTVGFTVAILGVFLFFFWFFENLSSMRICLTLANG